MQAPSHRPEAEHLLVGTSHAFLSSLCTFSLPLHTHLQLTILGLKFEVLFLFLPLLDLVVAFCRPFYQGILTRE